MMKKHLPYIVSILTGLVFIFSGVVKLFPIYAFEHQIVAQNLMGWTLAQFFSRALIGFEIGLGLLLMQKWNLKKLIIPSALMLLVAFSIYLLFSLYLSGGKPTSCGCFGELVPMSDGVSFLKNTVLIAMLVYVLYCIEDKPGKTALHLLILTAIYVFIFIVFPFKKFEPAKVLPLQSPVKISEVVAADTSRMQVTRANINKEESAKEIVLPKVQSPFSDVTKFLWKDKTVTIDINSGKKLVCLLSLDCEHCMAAATEIANLQSQKSTPQVVAMYFGEESELQPFIAKTHFNAPYVILPPEKFFPMIKNVPPRIALLNNGNVIGDWNGEEFNIEKLKTVLEQIM